MILLQPILDALATAGARVARKEINRRRYKRRYARIGRALAEGRKP